MTTLPLELHQAERQRAQNESRELTDVQMFLVSGLGLLTIVSTLMIIFFSMPLLK